MSVLTPPFNEGQANSGTEWWGAALPTGAGAKPPNCGWAMFGFMRTPPQKYQLDNVGLLFSRGGGTTGSNDSFLRFQDLTGTSAFNDASTLEARVRSGGFDIVPNLALAAPGLDALMLWGLIVRNDKAYLVLCVPGSEPTYVPSAAITTQYTSAYTAMTRMGGAETGTNPGSPVYATHEEWCFWHGLFPSPETTAGINLIKAIADGSQDLDTVHTLMTNGVSGTDGTGTGARRFRYKLSTAQDLANAWQAVSGSGGWGDLVPTKAAATAISADDLEAGRRLLTSGPLRPGGKVRPTFVRSHVSQVMFGTTGVASTAFSTMPIEGGALSGLTGVTQVRVRLVKEDGTTVTGFTGNAIPGYVAGAATWPASKLANVPMTAGWLTVQFAPFNAAGTQLADWTPGHGVRGSGFSMAGFSGQSESAVFDHEGFNYDASASNGIVPAAIKLALGARALQLKVRFDGAIFEFIMGNGTSSGRGVPRATRQLVNEIHALFPGVPVEFSTISKEGQHPSVFAPGGTYQNNWQLLRNLRGQECGSYFLGQYGHSSHTLTVPEYLDVLTQTITLAESKLGTATRVLLFNCPNHPVYDDSANQYDNIATVIDAMAQYRTAFPAKAFRAYGTEPILGPSGRMTGNHPPQTDACMGRAGSIVGWTMLSAANAVPQRPRGLKAKREGTGVRLRYEPVNA